MPVNFAFLYDCAQGIVGVSTSPCQCSIVSGDFFFPYFVLMSCNKNLAEIINLKLSVKNNN